MALNRSIFEHKSYRIFLMARFFTTLLRYTGS
ncbi:hypothetical protein EM595_1212 [Duffyella gerundensis]|uniref:Uncharacterized protein n=1 Tax=Duffyella gerundensis TaxID=1619313 RepID=A0A0U5L4P6_9GAMM|nr:hypothetical protein EM595_1212 [Duffyella gerundensis]